MEEVVLRRKMADDPDILFAFEIELAINIITQAILNPGKLV